VKPRRVLLPDVQHVQHRLLREELKAADAFLLLGAKRHGPERHVRFERGLRFLQQIELVVEIRALDLLAVLVEALQALLHHHEVAQDELRIHVVHVAGRIDGALLVGHGVALENTQHVGERVGDPQAGEVRRFAQVLLGDRREVQVFDGGVGDLARLK
jgi:hypothetical protein